MRRLGAALPRGGRGGHLPGADGSRKGVGRGQRRIPGHGLAEHRERLPPLAHGPAAGRRSAGSRIGLHLQTEEPRRLPGPQRPATEAEQRPRQADRLLHHRRVIRTF